VVVLDDDLAALDIARVDWLKSDVEGAELGLLLGAQKTLQRHRPRLIIEDHESVSSDQDDAVSRYPESVQSRARITAMLEGLGYRIERVLHDVSRWYFVAEVPAEDVC
jgi:hypothetical protein